MSECPGSKHLRTIPTSNWGLTITINWETTLTKSINLDSLFNNVYRKIGYIQDEMILKPLNLFTDESIPRQITSDPEPYLLVLNFENKTRSGGETNLHCHGLLDKKINPSSLPMFEDLLLKCKYDGLKPCNVHLEPFRSYHDYIYHLEKKDIPFDQVDPRGWIGYMLKNGDMFNDGRTSLYYSSHLFKRIKNNMKRLERLENKKQQIKPVDLKHLYHVMSPDCKTRVVSHLFEEMYNS